MVVDLLLKVVQGMVAWTLGLLPHLAVPDWLTQGIATFDSLLSGLSGTQGWLPWTALSLAIGLALAAAAVTVAIRGFRIVLSFLTLGGGGA